MKGYLSAYDRNNELEKEVSRQKPGIVLWIVFFSCLVIVLVTLTSVLFPASLLRTMGGFPNYAGINPYKTGAWALPLVVTDSIVFAITILYFKNKLPQVATKPIRFIFDFEISAQIAFIVVLILLGIFITFTVSQLFTPEPWEDYAHYKEFLDKTAVSDIIREGFGRQVKDLLLFSSIHMIGNDKVVPFIESIALLVLTYFFTSEITKKRFAGIVSMIIVLQSSIFLTYATSPTYEYSWILLYLLSLYLISKRWPLSPVSYVSSLFSKPLATIFFPMTFFFIYRSDISRQKKVCVAVSYGAIVAIITVVFVFFNGVNDIGGQRAFNSHDFWAGFSALSFELRFDGLVILFLLPLIIGLAIASMRRVVHADSILVLIAGILLLSSLLPALTYETNQPYRFMPVVVFFAMGVGTLLSKNLRKPV